ncbi:MAG: hypothetical protein Kow0042_30640 [Calditrichia bacterium]
MGKRKKKRKKLSAMKLRLQEHPSFLQSTSPISLCMIVKNEEKFLAGCLESVRDVVGEMVVVDTGSTDGTVEIAQRYSAKVFHYEWKDDFAAARNFALRHCSQPWILFLDADERLRKGDHDKIRQAVTSGKADAYYLKVYSTVSGILGDVPHMQAYPRLFRKLPGAQFEGKIHEQITPSLKKLKARFEYLDATIDHLGYSQEDGVLKNKIKRNLKLLREQIKKEPDNAYAHFQMGQTLLLNEETAEGISYLKKALNFHTLPNNLTSTTLLMLANEFYKSEDYTRALEYIERALQLAPRQRLGYFLQSECFAHQNRWPEALNALDQVRRHSDAPFSDISIEKNFDEYLIAQRFGLYYFNLGKRRQAFLEFSQYLKTAPTLRSSLLEKWAYAWKLSGSPAHEMEPLLEHLKTKLEAFDEPVAAAKVLAGIAEILNKTALMHCFLDFWLKQKPDDPAALYYLGNQALHQGDYERAAELYSLALKSAGDIWEIHYNLAVTQIKLQHYPEAIEVLEKAQRLFPEKEAVIQRLLVGLYGKLGNYERVFQYVNQGTGI